MQIKITQEHVDAAKSAFEETGDLCGCCVAWQALRPVIGHGNFYVGLDRVFHNREYKAGKVTSPPLVIGELDNAGANITTTLSKHWGSLVGSEFGYTPVPEGA